MTNNRAYTKNNDYNIKCGDAIAFYRLQILYKPIVSAVYQ